MNKELEVLTNTAYNVIKEETFGGRLTVRNIIDVLYDYYIQHKDIPFNPSLVADMIAYYMIVYRGGIGGICKIGLKITDDRNTYKTFSRLVREVLRAKSKGREGPGGNGLGCLATVNYCYHGLIIKLYRAHDYFNTVPMEYMSLKGKIQWSEDMDTLFDLIVYYIGYHFPGELSAMTKIKDRKEV
jgi:hypothetical protein